MTLHEFGKENIQTAVLIHPSLVMWDYFEYIIPLMQEHYWLIVPALPGYDRESPGDFSSVEAIAAGIADELSERGIKEVSCIYGCSMGGSIVLRMLAEGRVKAHSAVIDGGITPYQLPLLATRFIAIKDFLTIYAGKLVGTKLLEKAFKTDEYSKDDLAYVNSVLNYISAKTIWRTFESCNNYNMPFNVQPKCDRIEYWCAQSEVKARKRDIAYVKRVFPQTEFHIFENIGHGGLAAMKPQLMVKELIRAMGDAHSEELP